jgi:hypothetical protein
VILYNCSKGTRNENNKQTNIKQAYKGRKRLIMTTDRIKVQNMVNSNGNAVKNQFVIFVNDDKVVFQSYETTICIVDYANRNVFLSPEYKHSVTTSRYFNLFCKKYSGILWKFAGNSKALQEAIDIGGFINEANELFYNVIYDYLK